MDAKELRDYFLRANAKRIPCPVCEGQTSCPVCMGSRLIAREGVPYALARFEAAMDNADAPADLRDLAVEDAAARMAPRRSIRPAGNKRMRQLYDDAEAADGKIEF